MEHLEAEFIKSNCPGCPLVSHLGTKFHSKKLLKIISQQLMPCKHLALDLL